MSRSVRAASALLVALLAVGCAGTTSPEPEADPSSSGSSSGATTVPPVERPAPQDPAPGTVAPPWLGTRVLPRRDDGFGEVEPTPVALRDRRFTLPDTLEPLAGKGFAARVTPAPPEVIERSTWEQGCPVDRSELAWVRLAFWGFDDERHTGELLVNATVADDLVEVFRTLYEVRFPIEEMRVTRHNELDAPPTGDGNTTGVFVCRPTVGATTFSQHAHGLAIDLNPFQNPYLKGDLVLPELSSSYLDRGHVRPGMVLPGDEVVAAFAAIGWSWGGDWQSLKDYQHFSQNGR